MRMASIGEKAILERRQHQPDNAYRVFNMDRKIIERRSFARDDHVGDQGVLGMDIESAFHRSTSGEIRAASKRRHPYHVADSMSARNRQARDR
jgi:hypothetical protein